VEVKRQAPSIRTLYSVLVSASVSVLVWELVLIWDSRKYLQEVDWEVRKEAPSMRKLFSVSVSMPVPDVDVDFDSGLVAKRRKYLELDYDDDDDDDWILEQLGRCKKKTFLLRLWFRLRLLILFWMWFSFGV
jgi:hypothetical protein